MLRLHSDCSLLPWSYLIPRIPGACRLWRIISVDHLHQGSVPIQLIVLRPQFYFSLSLSPTVPRSLWIDRPCPQPPRKVCSTESLTCRVSKRGKPRNACLVAALHDPQFDHQIQDLPALNFVVRLGWKALNVWPLNMIMFWWTISGLSSCNAICEILEI